MIRRCAICSRLMDQSEDPFSRDCGGDCLKCMAEAGDPDCIEVIKEIQSREGLLPAGMTANNQEDMRCMIMSTDFTKVAGRASRWADRVVFNEIMDRIDQLPTNGQTNDLQISKIRGLYEFREVLCDDLVMSGSAQELSAVFKKHIDFLRSNEGRFVRSEDLVSALSDAASEVMVLGTADSLNAEDVDKEAARIAPKGPPSKYDQMVSKIDRSAQDAIVGTLHRYAGDEESMGLSLTRIQYFRETLKRHVRQADLGNLPDKTLFEKIRHATDAMAELSGSSGNPGYEAKVFARVVPQLEKISMLSDQAEAKAQMGRNTSPSAGNSGPSM